jgi:hypothetical protein
MSIIAAIATIQACAQEPNAGKVAPASQSDELQKVQAQLELMQSRVAELSQTVIEHAGDIAVAKSEAESALNQFSEGEFDPTDSKFQRIDAGAGVGSFAVSVEDVRQFGDGVRVRINLGNLTTARIAGAKLSLEYGPRKPVFGGQDYAQKRSLWEQAIQKREQDVLDRLIPGSWNPVSVVLPQIEEKNFGYLKVSIETKTIELTTGRQRSQ